MPDLVGGRLKMTEIRALVLTHPLAHSAIALHLRRMFRTGETRNFKFGTRQIPSQEWQNTPNGAWLGSSCQFFKFWDLTWICLSVVLLVTIGNDVLVDPALVGSIKFDRTRTLHQWNYEGMPYWSWCWSDATALDDHDNDLYIWIE